MEWAEGLGRTTGGEAADPRCPEPSSQGLPPNPPTQTLTTPLLYDYSRFEKIVCGIGLVLVTADHPTA